MCGLLAVVLAAPHGGAFLWVFVSSVARWATRVLLRMYILIVSLITPWAGLGHGRLSVFQMVC